MARDGSGTFNLAQPPFVTGTIISTTAVNSDLSDIAAGLTQSLSKDGQTTPSANLPMGGFKHTGVATASARDQYATFGQVQDSASIWCGTAGGTGDALTLGPTPAITSYAAGQTFLFLAGANNTGATTVAVSGLAAKNIFLSAACQGGEIVSGELYQITYDGTQFQLVPLERTDTQPLVVGSADATKRVRLEVDGLTTGTTRTLTVPDASGTLSLSTDFAYANLSGLAGRLILPQGYISGCEIANGTDTVNDIDFAAGQCRDSTNTVNIINSATITKRLDANWSAGTGNGGLDTGAAGPGAATYHCFLIRKDSDGVIDALFSTSATAPTMPGGYTYFRRVGSVTWDGGTIAQFSQFGNEFVLRTPLQQIAETNLSTAGILEDLQQLPEGIKVRAQITAAVSRAGTGYVLISSFDSVNTVPSATIYSAAVTSSVYNVIWMQVRTSTARQIRCRASAANTSLDIYLYGWFDERQ